MVGDAEHPFHWQRVCLLISAAVHSVAAPGAEFALLVMSCKALRGRVPSRSACVSHAPLHSVNTPSSFLPQDLCPCCSHGQHVPSPQISLQLPPSDPSGVGSEWPSLTHVKQFPGTHCPSSLSPYPVMFQNEHVYTGALPVSVTVGSPACKQFIAERKAD